MGAFQDLSGIKFGYLCVIKASQHKKGALYAWLCKCVCGNIKSILAKSLKCGDTKSCGCLAIKTAKKLMACRNKTHECSNTRIYRIWRNMRARCLNRNVPNFKHYGGRGINICERWLKFANFLSDMGHPPSKHHTIERHDNNKDYCPENCYWIIDKFQASNRRSNRPITFRGKTMILKEWAKITGIHRRTITSRIDKFGWSIKDALTIHPVKHNHK